VIASIIFLAGGAAASQSIRGRNDLAAWVIVGIPSIVMICAMLFLTLKDYFHD